MEHLTKKTMLLKEQHIENAAFELECYWIEALILYRIEELCKAPHTTDFPTPPAIKKGGHPYFDDLANYTIAGLGRIALSLTLIAQTFPKFLDALYTNNQIIQAPFKEFGVFFEGTQKTLRPTWQTAMFLHVGTNLQAQLQLIHYIHSDHPLYVNKLLTASKEPQENPFLTPLQLHRDRINGWLYQATQRNLASQDFAAHEIASALNWSDLFMATETSNGLVQLKQWLQHGGALQNNPIFAKHISPGVRVLFYGPSGTGKTLTASLLGKEFKLPVYRVDVSQMVSKWIGETEKNLARIFDRAEQQGWILFFDEADALFSKRGAVKSAQDRRSNQEISYLLQRVENYDGTIIMATNLKDNIDDAFLRRFQLLIHFPIPNAQLRAQLWKHLLEGTFPMEPSVDLSQIAGDYELTGGSMKNVFRAYMLALYDAEPTNQLITSRGLRKAIEEELSKAGVIQVKKWY